ncbi:MAG TPA: NAD-dependent epimerase/dehydratase family protein [bacterium]|nr:NAD-dependent epimerase/dehydratase family protein [bacterium]
MTAGKGRALVTGGAGLIGSHLVDLLLEEGYDVAVLDNLEPQTHPQGKPKWVSPEVRFIQGDIRNEEDLRKSLEGVQFLFHQAAFGGFTPALSKYLDVNAVGTAKIFELLATGKFTVKKVVVASSQAIYAEGAYHCPSHGSVFPKVRPLTELQKKQWEPVCPSCAKTMRPSPTPEEKSREGETPYALSKEFEERLALGIGRQLQIPVVALRYGVTYGPRQSVFNPYTGVVSIFSTRILNRLRPLVYEDGLQTRDFIYVGDVAKANLFAMENKACNFQALNVGTGKPTDVCDLAKMLSRIYGTPVEPELCGQFRWGDVRHIILDPSKLKALGFEAKTTLQEGLTFFADWIRGEGKIGEYFTEAYENLKKNHFIYD